MIETEVQLYMYLVEMLQNPQSIHYNTQLQKQSDRFNYHTHVHNWGEASKILCACLVRTSFRNISCNMCHVGFAPTTFCILLVNFANFFQKNHFFVSRNSYGWLSVIINPLAITTTAYKLFHKHVTHHDQLKYVATIIRRFPRKLKK